MRFWTSDLHFGHANIREYCPDRLALGPDVDSMNVELIERWNETVMPSDDIWIVGDLCMGKLADTLPLVARLNGHKQLFVGNHDRPFKEKGRSKWELAYSEVGIESFTYGTIHTTIGRYSVSVNHFPYEGDSHDEDRFVDHRPKNQGQILIHGHVHDTWKINGRQINVGVDVWDYRPVHEDEIVAIVSAMR